MVRDASGAGHAASPLGQPAPLAPTNQHISPHNIRGPKRVNPISPQGPHMHPHFLLSSLLRLAMSRSCAAASMEKP